MINTVTLLPGDGIGPEIMAATVRVLEAAGAKLKWETVTLGTETVAKTGQLLPAEVLDLIRRNRVALKGPMTTPIGTGHASLNVALRKTFTLYANLRPCKSIAGIKSRYENVDLIIVRENTEGEYSGLEHEVVPGVVESLKIITRVASERVARFAFNYAATHGRKRVTAVHKANIMKKSDGLFLECTREVAKKYPKIKYDELIVDNACLQLTLEPSRYDVLVMPNLYGDIISDLCAAFVGGLGVMPSGNIGDECAVFEAVHGTAPDIVGQGKANPTALIRSSVMMLRHIGQLGAADRIERAVHRVIGEGKHTTADLGGKASTGEYVDAIIAQLHA
jgi:isocitrate dehydrogenase (NAD+)